MRDLSKEGEEIAMDYDEAVGVAARALRRGEEASWELARLTSEQTVNGRGGDQRTLGTQRSLGERSGPVQMAQWCADVRERATGIKFSEWTGRAYKRIWSVYGHLSAEDRPSWSEAYKEVVDGATPEAREQRAVERFLREGEPERKRDAFLRLAHDEAVADPRTVDAANELLQRRAREVRGMPPLPARLHPELREAVEQRDSSPLRGARDAVSLMLYIVDGRVAAKRYADVLRQTGPLDDEARAHELGEIDSVIAAWSRLREIVAGGSLLGDVDAFLTAVRSTD
jgi:hypothetical protein